MEQSVWASPFERRFLSWVGGNSIKSALQVTDASEGGVDALCALCSGPLHGMAAVKRNGSWTHLSMDDTCQYYTRTREPQAPQRYPSGAQLVPIIPAKPAIVARSLPLPPELLHIVFGEFTGDISTLSACRAVCVEWKEILATKPDLWPSDRTPSLSCSLSSLAHFIYAFPMFTALSYTPPAQFPPNPPPEFRFPAIRVLELQQVSMASVQEMGNLIAAVPVLFPHIEALHVDLWDGDGDEERLQLHHLDPLQHLQQLRELSVTLELGSVPWTRFFKSEDSRPQLSQLVNCPNLSIFRIRNGYLGPRALAGIVVGLGRKLKLVELNGCCDFMEWGHEDIQAIRSAQTALVGSGERSILLITVRGCYFTDEVKLVLEEVVADSGAVIAA